MNTNSLRDDSIISLIAKFSIPAIVGMVVNAIYNIVDRIFIGKYVGEEALASLMVVFPIIMIVFAISVLISQGGSNLVSIRLGERKEEEASKIFTNTIVLGFFAIIIVLGITMTLLDEMLLLMGTSGLVFEFSKSYLGIYLMFTPIALYSFMFSTIVRAEGHPNLSMNSMIASALTNIVLDYVFIAIFGWGVAGGALATGIGQTVGFCILLTHFINKKSKLHFDTKNLKPNWEITKETFSIGFPSFLTTVGTSAFMLILNFSLNEYGGVAAVTAMAAINSLFTIVIMPINGVQGGIQPIVGYNHGAKLHNRVRETIVKAIMITVSFSFVFFVIIQAIPATLLSMFIASDSDTMPVAIQGLRIFILGLPFVCINIISVGYFQATQKPKIAITLGVIRQFVILIPLLLILPKFIGLLGVWLAIPIADYIAICISGLMLRYDFKKGKALENELESDLENIELA